MKRRWLNLLLTFLFGVPLYVPAQAWAEEPAQLTVNAAVAAAEDARIAAVNKAVPSVLAIFAPGGNGGGSGVVISPDGYALSNFHVTKPCGNFMKCGMADGKLYDAVIVGIDPVGDVALIKLFGRDDFPTAEMANSDQVQVGDWCFAMGNPFLLATDFYPSVSYGVVSGTHRYQYPAGTLLEYADCLQVDAAINPGNSGGPLFDAQGRLIGVNGRGSFEKRGRVNVGVGYAISINQIKNFLGHLKAGKIVDHATLGARVATADDGRVLVSDILDSADVSRRGLRYDDEIVSFAGRPIRTTNALKNVLGIFPRGWRVPLTYRRDNQNYDTYVRLMGVHREAELIAKVEGRDPNAPQPQPRKPRGEEPKDGEPKPAEQPKPGDKKDELPKPLPVPKIPGLEDVLKAPMPAHVKKQFEARPGYANYFFNKQNVDRLWKGTVARGDFSGNMGTWTMTGQPASGGAIVVRLGDAECEIELPTGDSKIVLADGLDAVLNPPGSGGMLAALHLWKRLITGGPGKYGQVTYEGTGPLANHEGLFDFLHAVGGGVETRFYFSPADGSLVCVEMFPEDEVDPCEIYFSDYREQQGRFLPHRWEVRRGDELFGVYVIDKFDLSKPAEVKPQ